MKLPQNYVPGVGVVKHKGGFGGFGQKMLEKMGWQRGQGLGKEKSGMADAIEVKKKEDALGVGATQTGWKWDWKYWEDAYNTGIQTVAHDGDSSSSDSDSDSDSEAPTPAAARSRSASAAPRGGKSAATSDSDSDSSSDEGEPALDRLASCVVAVNRDGTVASASAHELAIARALADSKDSRGPAGRFGGRAGKMARIREQEAKLAEEARSKLGILTPAVSGAAAASAGGAAAPSGSKKRKGNGSSSDGEGAGGAVTDADSAKRRKGQESGGKADKKAAKEARRAEKAAKKAAKAAKRAGDGASDAEQQPGSRGDGGSELQQRDGEQQQQKPRPKVIIVALKGEEERHTQPFVPTPSDGWWGSKMFKSAGRLEGMEEEEKEAAAAAAAAKAAGKEGGRKRGEFTEDTQADLYNRLQAAQRQGKRGMGRAAVKIAGGNWEGKKTTFAEPGSGDEEDAGAAEAPGDAAAGSSGDEAAAAVAAAKARPGKRRKGADSADGSSKRSKREKDKGGKQSDGEGALTKVKWVKLAVAQLEKAPKARLRWSALWAALWEQDVVSGAGLGAKEAKRAAWERISGSSKVEVDGKKVRLVAAKA